MDSTSEHSDSELVRACAAGNRDEPFAELIRRHGRVVLAVCRGVLGNEADAEDAFQATFLVFLRRAGELNNPNMIAAWLGGVAARVAHRTRQRRTRDRQREKALTMSTPSEPTNGEPVAESNPVLAALATEEREAIWQELAALPDKYRSAVLLCHLQEQTTEDAAAALGCPVGTLRSRLLKAREMLRSRLTRRGLVAASALALAVLSDTQAKANPPAELVQRTARAARTGASPIVTRLVNDSARSPAARWRWLGVSAGLLTLLVLAILKLSQPQEEQAPEPSIPPLAGTEHGGTLLVVSQVEAKVYLLDPRTGRVRAVVGTDPCPHEVAVSPDGAIAVVASYGLPFGRDFGGTVTLVDVRGGQKLRTVNTGAASAPHGLFWRGNRTLLCTLEGQQALVEIDAEVGRVVRTIRTAQGATHMVVAAGNRAFTTNATSNSVTSIDLVEGVKLRDRALGNWPEGIALSPDGRQLWVANRNDNTVSVLNANDLAIQQTLPTPGTPLRLQFTPDGKTVAATMVDSGELAFFDVATRTETRRVKLSAGKVQFDTPGPAPAPVGLVFSPDGRTAYCSVFVSKAVAVIDVASGTVTAKFDLPGEGIDGIALSLIGE